MKRNVYQKPAIDVFKVQHAKMIMTSTNAVRSSYGKANSDVDELEEDETGNKGIWVWD